MKPKLAIFLYSMGAGGAERVVSILIKELVKEYDVTLILMCDIIFYDIPKEVNIEFIEKSIPPEKGFIKLLKLPVLAIKYRNILKKRDIKLSVSFMNRPNYINILANISKKISYTIVSERTTPSTLYHTKSINDRVSKWFIKTLYPYADIVMPNSWGTAIDLNKNYGINQNKIKVLFNPIDTQEIYKKYQESLYIENNNTFIFTFIARMEEQKNHKLLIESFAKANITKSKLWLIGDGHLKDELQHLAIKLGIQKQVVFWGRQNNPFKFLKLSDSFVMSSNFEGFPNVLIEALSCSLPVISTDCFSGPREILDNNIDYSKPIKELKLAKYGILVPPNSINEMSKAMKILYSNKKLKEEYKNRAKLRAKDFDKDIILKEFKNIIKEYI